MMKTFEVDGLFLEARSVNDHIQHGIYEPRHFQGKEVAVIRNGQFLRIRPKSDDDESVTEDGTYRVNVDEFNSFDSKSTWYLMSSNGRTASGVPLVDGGMTDRGIDAIHVVVGRVGEVDMAHEPTPENRIITVGDREFLIVDNKAYEIYK